MMALVIGWLNIAMLVSRKHLLRNQESGEMLPMNTFPNFFFINVLEDNAKEKYALEY